MDVKLIVVMFLIKKEIAKRLYLSIAKYNTVFVQKKIIINQ